MSENENPNKLFIIGNGFDLAHGLKTKYEDFLWWYINSFFYSENDKISDGIMNRNSIQKIKFRNLEGFYEYFKTELLNYNKLYSFNHKFFQDLLDKYSFLKWVDIEQEYYNYLVNLFQNYELNKKLDDFFKNVQLLNNHFSSITEKFKEYICNNLDTTFNIQNEIIDHLKRALKFNVIDHEEIMNQVVFLNFNYSHTIEPYLNEVKVGQDYYFFDIINIHGSIDNPDDIIFGYGDEDDSYYEKLERLNNNSVLNHFKSFGYMKNDKYQNISSFIDAMRFDVYILGHSCGISDRVLLSSIFSHPNCNKIQIFYHQKSETENDFFEKTQQISRHFKAGMKNEMRKRIVPFSECKPLVSFKN